MGFEDMLVLPSKNNSDILKNVKENLISKVGEKKGLSIGNLLALAKDGFFNEHGHIHEFLEKSEIVLLATPSQPRNPELEVRIKKLKAEQENEEYRKMVRGLEPIHTQQMGISVRNEVKLVTSQVTAVINFVLTVVGSFFFTYKAVEYALPESNIPAQVLMGIITSTVVALADLFFLARTI